MDADLEKYRKLEEELAQREAAALPDDYWLAGYLPLSQINKIILRCANPDYTHVSLPGQVYEALIDAGRSVSNDPNKLSEGNRLLDLARLVAAATLGQMTPQEQKYLTQKAENTVHPYKKDVIETTEATRQDLAWISRQFAPNLQLPSSENHLSIDSK